MKLFKEDEYYIYLDIKPMLGKDKQEFQQLRLALYGPKTQFAYLPAQVYMVKPNGETEQWKLDQTEDQHPEDRPAKSSSTRMCRVSASSRPPARRPRPLCGPASRRRRSARTPLNPRKSGSKTPTARSPWALGVSHFSHFLISLSPPET